MRIEIDSIQEKMDHFLETMLALAQKKKDAETNAKAKRVVAQFNSSLLRIPKVVNLDGGFVHPGGLSPFLYRWSM